MWELWTGREPYEGLSYVNLMMQLVDPNTRLRPPLPGSTDWEGEGPPPPELAPGWSALMQRCWKDSPDDRPPFHEIIKDLRRMVAAIRPQRNKQPGERSGVD